MLFRGFCCATLALAMCAVLVGSASAAPGNGAQVNTIRECQDVGGGFTFCQTLHEVVKTTATPSGNLSLLTNRRSDFTFSGPGCRESSSATLRHHSLLKGGVTHEISLAEQGRLTADCGGFVVQCEFVSHFHFANGQVQFNRTETHCGLP